MQGRKPETSHEKMQRDKSPGPCYYNTTREFGKDTTSVSISAKPKWKPLNVNPGPCDYDNINNPSKPRTPAFDMSKTKPRKYAKRDKTPAAGHYEPHKKFGTDIQGGTIGVRNE